MEEDYEGEGADAGAGAGLSRKRSVVASALIHAGLPIPEAHPGSMKIEQTLCLVKPDAMERCDEIVTIISREGFSILQSRRVNLNAEQTSQFYQDNYEQPWFSDAVAHLYSGPILALLLSGPGAILHLNIVLGPESYEDRKGLPNCLRTRFGTEGSDIQNGLHGSLTEADAFREIHFFFPERVIEPILTSNFASYYLNENVHPVLNIGLTELVREKPQDPILWLSDWLISNNPNKPKELSDAMCK